MSGCLRWIYYSLRRPCLVTMKDAISAVEPSGRLGGPGVHRAMCQARCNQKGEGSSWSTLVSRVKRRNPRSCQSLLGVCRSNKKQGRNEGKAGKIEYIEDREDCARRRLVVALEEKQSKSSSHTKTNQTNTNRTNSGKTCPPYTRGRHSPSAIYTMCNQKSSR
jgi:hypothetical protein